MSDHDIQVRNLAARAFWIDQGLPSPTAAALADYGVNDLEQLSSSGRTVRLLIPDMGEVGIAAVEKLLDRGSEQPR